LRHILGRDDVGEARDFALIFQNCALPLAGSPLANATNPVE
jgi:hypothetical protein